MAERTVQWACSLRYAARLYGVPESALRAKLAAEILPSDRGDYVLWASAGRAAAEILKPESEDDVDARPEVRPESV